MWLRVFQHLLPDARAWRLNVGKQLRQFFEALTQLPEDVKNFYDLIWLDLDPLVTRELQAWEAQFALPDCGLTEPECRARLDAAWKARGGQSPRYIQDTLQAAGFDVYVHEWWGPGSNPPVARDPNDHLTGTGGDGYMLVNKIVEFVSSPLGDGEESMQDGDELAQDGGGISSTVLKEYAIPSDPDKFPYFLYIGGETFPNLASIDPDRQDEFENLCLKICPEHLWLGLLVEYV